MTANVNKRSANPDIRSNDQINNNVFVVPYKCNWKILIVINKTNKVKNMFDELKILVQPW